MFVKKMSRDRKTWTRLLERYRELSLLWDKTNLKYNDRGMREEGYRQLLKIYREIDDEATIPVLKKKIDNMRTCYIREFKKVIAASHAGEEYVPSLWYFSLLSFLAEGSEHSEAPVTFTYETVETQDSDNNEQDQTSDDQMTDDAIVLPRKKLRKSISIKQEDASVATPKFVEYKEYNPLETAQIVQNPKEEEWEVMGKYIALQLKDVDKKQLIIANKIISDAIFYAKMGRLTADSSINLGNSSSI